MRISTVQSRRGVAARLMLAALGASTVLAPGLAAAQRVDFTQPLRFSADPGLDLGSSDTRTARRAVLAVGDRTWVTGRFDDPGEDDVYVARFGPGGAQELFRVYDLGGQDTGIALAPAGNGAAYVAARTTAVDAQRVHVMRIEADGNPAWRFEVPNAGLWDFLQSDLLLSSDGAGGLVVGINGSQQGGIPVIVLARLQDQGNAATLTWQSTLQPTARAYEQLALEFSADASRIAVSAAAFVQFPDPRAYVALVNAANGGVIAATLSDDRVQRVLPAQFAPDGSLRVATREQLTANVRLLRFSANGVPAPVTALACSASDCEIDAVAVTSDGATVVLGSDFGTDAAVLLRFDPAGVPTWTRRYPFGARSNGRSVSAIGTAVDIGLDARLDDNDRSTTRWLVGRVDATGSPTDTTGFLVEPSRSANLVTMQRAANGVLSLAGGEAIDQGRVMVAQMVSSEPAARFLVAATPGSAPAEFFSTDVALQLDTQGRPLVAFRKRGNDFRGFGVRAFTAAGSVRWSADSDPLLREQDPSAALDAQDRLSVATAVGNFPPSQLGLRQFGPDGALLQGPTFTAEPGISGPLTAVAADGTRLLAASLGESSVVVRLIEATGQTRWRRVITTGGSFPRAYGIFRLPGGDAAILYTPGFGPPAGLVGQRLAQSDGAPAAPISVAAVGFGFPRRVQQDGARVLAAVVDDSRVQFACFDFLANNVCFNREGPTLDLATFADMAFDPAQATLYAGLTAAGSVARPRLIALDSTTGAVRADVTLEERPVSAVRGVFVRGGNPVLVANRRPDAGSGSPGLEMYTLSPQGQLLEQASLNAGQRLEVHQLRYDPVADRAYLLATRVPPQGAAEPSLVGVAFDRPAQVFSDGFE